VRSFLAVYPGEEARGVLADVAPDDAVDVRVTDMADWHITLRFLGELDDERVSTVGDVVCDTLDGVSPIRVSIGPTTALGAGARVLFAPAKGLEQVVDTLDRALDSSVEPRDGPFRGHLTLARARGRGRIPGALAGTSVHVSFVASEVVLVGSMLEPERAVHHVVRRFPLEERRST
jgi:RNA 2',3'-cyclic 3'-phosphodiesterase